MHFIWGVDDDRFLVEQALFMADQFFNNHGMHESIEAHLHAHEEMPDQVARHVIGFVTKSLFRGTGVTTVRAFIKPVWTDGPLDFHLNSQVIMLLVLLIILR